MEALSQWEVVRCRFDTVRTIGEFLKGGGFYHQVWLQSEGWFEVEPYLPPVREGEVTLRLNWRVPRFFPIGGPLVVGTIRIANRLEVDVYAADSTLRWYWQIDDGALEFRLYENGCELVCIHRLIPIR